MVTGKMEGTNLVLTIDCSGKPYVSKSAQAKAASKGIDIKTLVPEAIATSGGFMRVGNFKVSVNVNKA